MNKLTRKQKKFADAYIDGKSGIQAILKSYDTDSSKVASVMAVENLAKPSVREYIESKAEVVAEVVYNLAIGAENETVQLNASKDILDRAGYKPIEKTQSLNVNVEARLEDKSGLEAIRLKYEEELRDKLITK